MAIGINSRDRDLANVLQSILNRLTALEHPNSLRIGPTPGITPIAPGDNTGFTLSVNASGQLVATSDRAIVSLVASP